MHPRSPRNSLFCPRNGDRLPSFQRQLVAPLADPADRPAVAAGCARTREPQDALPCHGRHPDRLGVRVPAILVSPFVAKGTVVDDGRVFEHSSIPATAMKWLLPNFDNTQRSPREVAAPTFLDLLTLDTMRTDTPEFS